MPTTTTTTTYQERALSASFGALLTALLVTPLEVAKVRLQTQLPSIPFALASTPNRCPTCSDLLFDDGLFERRVSKQCFSIHHFNQRPVQFRGTLHALGWIGKHEGLFSLYNGLHATLWMSIPATVLYFSLYDELKEILGRGGGSGGGQDRSLTSWKVALGAGTAARVVSATIVAPFELLRTKAQAETSPPGLVKLFEREVRGGKGVLVLWRGVSLTLMRDVPFSGVYWMVVEEAKARARWMEPVAPMGVSLLAAGLGGLVAAIVTHPFDVLKTRLQVFDFADSKGGKGGAPSIRTVLTDLLARDGIKGLYLGLGPRLVKIVPSTTIMLTTYDWGKRFFDIRRGTTSTAF